MRITDPTVPWPGQPTRPAPAPVGGGDHEDAVEIDGDPAVGVRGVLTRQRPGVMPDFGACGPDGPQSFLAGCREGVDQTGDGRVGGDRAEDSRLTPQRCNVREAVPAQCDRPRRVQESLARIVDGPRLPPRSQSCGYRLVKAVLRTVSISRTAPACETTCRPFPWTRTRGYDEIGSLTWKVLFSLQPTGPSASPIVAGQEHFPCF